MTKLPSIQMQDNNSIFSISFQFIDFENMHILVLFVKICFLQGCNAMLFFVIMFFVKNCGKISKWFRFIGHDSFDYLMKYFL